ncbi:DDE-type integrase/transposase/recombinase [Spirosoma endbachense]|uniref:DDE-type integrase/transposase/recombinase n=1 Tax=Spirosoma endbachense TaxID=2666025 RepID=A0A6P1VY74_9BACT|nr:DDE-type integrase/transposase/recombinase [Spirosoma endbachense]QHV96669.1 DDE-type integrase/transposase/recombinase [Spirosoma endbachense]
MGRSRPIDQGKSGCQTSRHGPPRYIATGQGWLYLTVILDLADRKVVGWAMSDSMKAVDTSVAAWRMTLTNRVISGKLVFHSDRGIQYACTEFRDELKDLPVEESMTGLPEQSEGKLLG